MTKEEIAVNAISAADIAGIDRRGYIMARMYELLHAIDSTNGEDERLFADLEATAPAVQVVWSIGDEADDEQDSEIAAAVAEAITSDEPEVDPTALPEGITGLAGEDVTRNVHTSGNLLVVDEKKAAALSFLERLGLKAS